MKTTLTFPKKNESFVNLGIKLAIPAATLRNLGPPDKLAWVSDCLRSTWVSKGLHDEKDANKLARTTFGVHGLHCCSVFGWRFGGDRAKRCADAGGCAG